MLTLGIVESIFALAEVDEKGVAAFKKSFMAVIGDKDLDQVSWERKHIKNGATITIKRVRPAEEESKLSLDEVVKAQKLIKLENNCQALIKSEFD